MVANGVVYVAGSDGITARRESDGGLLWTWAPPAPYQLDSHERQVPNLALTNNVLFVSFPATYTQGATFALDLGSHLPVWRYPMGGALALSGQGVLYVVQGEKVAAISLR